MNKRFYSRLALGNLRKNGRFYKPYLLTVTGAVAAMYMISSTTDPQGITSLFPHGVLVEIMNLGAVVVGVVSALFLLYTNSFLMKQRGREFGLYCILGMSKRNITRVLFWETVYTALAGIAGGLVTGGVFNKLLLLVLCRLTGLELAGPVFYGKSALRTAALFAALLLAVFLINSGRVHLSRPVALLQSGSAGEREPKARWFLAVLGLLCVGAGYYIAITTTSPLSALFLFFVAVLLVIAGTFLLFLAGTVAVLKLLRRRKRYYYKTRHFIAVSGLMYRMKRNAAGLAIICILSTAVLVMVSSTVSLYTGIGDMIDTTYPRQIMSYCTRNPDLREVDTERALAHIRGEGFHPENVQTYDLLQTSGLVTEEGISCDLSARNAVWSDVEHLRALYVMPEQTYEVLTGESVSLAPGELLLRGYGEPGDTVNIFGAAFTVAGQVPESAVTRRFELNFNSVNVVIAVAGEADFQALYDLQGQGYGIAASGVETHLDFDLPAGEDLAACREALEDIERLQETEGVAVSFLVNDRESAEQNSLELYGGLLYLGIFLGVLFLLGTVLIIYYKQLSEGYEDQGRYEIMQKVGMSRPEIAGAIRSQMLMVFFLPLVTAALHMLAACPLLLRLMKLLNHANTDSFVLCVAVSIALFAVIYIIVYLITARVYYAIVAGNREEAK